MTLEEIMTTARGFLDDERPPYLWKPIELVTYAIKSEQEFCKKTEVLIDSTTSPMCRVTTAINTMSYALDSRIIRIKRARSVTADRILTQWTTDYANRYFSGWDSSTASTGDPMHYMKDYQTGYLTLYPTPNAVDTIKLTVVRYPLTPLTLTALTASPEIPFQYHIDLIDGILWRAYAKQDAETYDAKKMATHKALWEARLTEVSLDILNENDIDQDRDQTLDYLEMD